MAQPFKQPGFSISRRIAAAKVREFSILDKFLLGYRNREDLTNLPPGVLIPGSQNVLTNVSGRVGITKGYTLDGQSSAVVAPILSAYDYEVSTGDIRHLRAGFLISNDGKLQFRFVHTDGTVEWLDLMAALTSVSFNFANWWDTVHSQSRLLFVNGLPKIYEWSGGVTTLDAASGSAGAVSGINNGIGPNGFILPETYGGQDYVVGDILTLTGGNADATVRVNSVFTDAVGAINVVPIAPGTGYSANEIIAVLDPQPSPAISGQGCIVRILTVDGGGGALTLELISQGHNYSLGTKATSSGATGGGNITASSINAGGTGYQVGQTYFLAGGNADADITITAINAGGAITNYTLNDPGSGYVTGTVGLEDSGTGSGGVLNITASSIVATGCTVEITMLVDGAIGTASTTTGAVSLINPGTGYSTASAIPVTGGSGTGALMQITDISNNTITKQGPKTWAQDGFYNAGTHQVVINGVTYTATGGWEGLTLTGVTPDPSGAGITGDVIFQAVETFNNVAIVGLPDTFANDLIMTLDAQLYIGSLTDNAIYVSKINNYKDFTFGQTHSTTRTTGQGIILIANSPPKAFIIQEELGYVSAGVSQWYTITQETISTPVVEINALPPISAIINIDVVTPTLNRLKTSDLQGAQSQAFVAKNKNDVIFVSFEPIVNSLGRVDNVVLTPQTADLSFPIVNDMNAYDLTDGCIFFHQNFIIVAVPKEGLIRLYNMTKDTTSSNPTNSPIHYWEAPLTMPISRFSIIDGELYGHSYLVSESYKLFDGLNFNGSPIPAVALFSYQQDGVFSTSKSFNEFYVEGYIAPNTTITLTLLYELNGFAGEPSFEISGQDAAIVQSLPEDNSLGKNSLGKAPLGGDIGEQSALPPKFRTIKTFPRTPYYEFAPQFSSVGKDFNWSILRFGPASTPTSEGNNPITE